MRRHGGWSGLLPPPKCGAGGYVCSAVVRLVGDFVWSGCSLRLGGDFSTFSSLGVPHSPSPATSTGSGPLVALSTGCLRIALVRMTLISDYIELKNILDQCTSGCRLVYPP
ncbi:hypothetical protein BRADI_5g06566v3 [Brachypodium distachyon]|uniref:Uncharacterized protein n=1 Tax=Brachypodium distachyon TaxID=15368 RepID=A0A2K2CFM9_BRADI|nr:hypothetical protein BRADI_5g06566v3 [Brachypodium distachyon]